MNVANLISLKRDGAELDEEQLRFLIEGYTSGEIPDYQMSAWAMAVYFQGLNPKETAILTRSMVDSGTRLVWPDQPPPVDNHSTGGVGDKISIILAPLLACCGVAVPMISGRGLGATGGTLDGYSLIYVPVPEPSSILLAAIALLCLLVHARRHA